MSTIESDRFVRFHETQVVDPKARLGAGPAGVEAIKSHAFFSGIDFETIWTVEPPRIETGLAEPRKEAKGEFVLLDDFGNDSEDPDDGLNGNDEDNEEDDTGEYEVEGDDGDGDSGLRRSDSIDSARAPSQLSHDDDGGGGSARTKWTGVLSPTEMITFASPVLVKKGLIKKKRALILTDYPRLICIKDSPTKVSLKSEVFLGQALKGGVTKPGASAFIKALTEGDRVIVIRTSQRTLRFEEPSGAAARWVAELADVHGRGLQGKGR